MLLLLGLLCTTGYQAPCHIRQLPPLLETYFGSTGWEIVRFALTDGLPVLRESGKTGPERVVS